MNGKRWSVMVVAGMLLAGGLLWNGTAQAFGRHDSHEGMDGAFPVLAMVRRSHLTDAQEKQVADILRNHKAALLDKTGKVSDARRAVVAQETADAVDASALAAAVDQSSATHKDLMLEWAQVRQEVQAVLTPEQVADLKQMRDKFLTKMDAHRADEQGKRGERLDHWIDKLAR